MKFSIFVISLLFLLLSVSCNKDQNEKPQQNSENIYISYAGEREGFKIFIVNGDEVRKKCFNEFVYGGNSERYTFIPAKEIWVDNSVSAEEMETTIAHELKERKLMAHDGLLYSDAHDSALALEVKMRKQWEAVCSEHESKLDSVTPRDFDSTMEIVTLPEKIKLKNIYRIPLGEKDGVKIWIVDGYVIRRDVFPDFDFSGNDKEYLFIPEGEIWIDGQISCEETNYSVASELKIRELIIKGLSYDSAYAEALKYNDQLRIENNRLISQQPAIKITDPPFRVAGTKSEY